MRRLMMLLLAGAVQLSAIPGAASDAAPAPTAKSAVLMCEDGSFLLEQNADQRLPMASTTKLMTALVVAERCSLQDSIEIQADWCGVEGSSMYLRAGERYTVRELLTGLLLASGNDAALALACSCAGGVRPFAELMNEKARALDLHDTHFMNPHGLNEPEHYSSARDLALLMRAVMRQPALAELLGMKSAPVGDRQIMNHNRLLQRCSGCIGGKTGYTSVAGRCLVSCVEREGQRLYCATLSDPDDWNDHIRLYDWGFSRFEMRILADRSMSYEVPVLAGSAASVRAIPAEELRRLLPRGEELSYGVELPFFCFAPIREGAHAGKLIVYSGQNRLAEIELVYEESVPIRQE